MTADTDRVLTQINARTPHSPSPPWSIEDLLGMIPENFDVTIRTTRCASDGSVEGQPNGEFWHCAVYLTDNTEEYDTATRYGGKCNLVGRRDDGILKALALAVHDMLMYPKK